MTSIPLPFDLPPLARAGSRAERPRIALYAWWAPTESEADALTTERGFEPPAAKDCADRRAGDPI